MLAQAFTWEDLWRLALAVFLFAIGLSVAWFFLRLAGAPTRGEQDPEQGLQGPAGRGIGAAGGLMALLPLVVYIVALSGALASTGKGIIPAVFAVCALLTAELVWWIIKWTKLPGV